MIAAPPMRAFGPLLIPASITNRTLLFATATTVAALLALWLAFWLELESPYWAATTVMIVSQPVPGQVVGKGFYRGLGTVAGAIAATVLMALFPQQPELFIGGMALWIAGCTYVSLLLRGFRSYGAVLSGYTAAIVAFGVNGNPSLVFDIAVARTSAILLGILCAAAVSALLIPGTAKADLVRRLHAAIGHAVELLEDVAAGRSGREVRRKLAREIAEIDGLTDAAAAEALAFRRRIDSVEAALARLFSILSAARSLEEHLRALDEARRDGQLAELQARLLPRLAALETRRLGSAGAGAEAGTAPPSPVPNGPVRPDTDAVASASIDERADDALVALAGALEAYDAVAGRTRVRPRGRLARHRDPQQARRNALRAFLAVVLAGTFWIASAWPTGSSFVANVGIICSLFAAQDRPSAAGIFFLKGILIALPLAFLWRFLILPWGEGFTFLALVLAPPIFLGAVAFLQPATARVATSFNVYFLSLVAPTNVMTYDPAAYFDSAVATLVGIGVGVALFTLVLPTQPITVARSILRRIRRDVARMALARGPIDREGFETLLYHRLARIFALSADERLLADGIAALTVALELGRLRDVGLPPPSRQAVDAAVTDIAAALRGRPVTALGTRLTQAAADLAAARHAVAPEQAGGLLRAEAALGMIRGALNQHPAIFGRAQEQTV